MSEEIKEELPFQFPLWDTSTRFVDSQGNPVTLSIPFMGYLDSVMSILKHLMLSFNSLYGILLFLPLTLDQLFHFQFPLWDTAI